MAEKNFQVHINLNRNELLNAKLQNLTTAPSVSASDVGFVYWNSVDNTAYAWTGSASTPNTNNGWLDLGVINTHPVFPGIGQPTTPLTGANVISQITLDNGHVTGVQTRALTAANIGAAAASHTHTFSQITGLPANTILGNNSGTTGVAQALTVGDLLTMLGIINGTLAQLNTGTSTSHSQWTAKDLNDWINAKLSSYITAVNLALGTRTATTMPITNSAGTGVTLPVATITLAGLMSAADKTKLDGISTGANNYIHPTNNPGAHPFASPITSGLLVLSQMVVNTEGHVTTIAGRNLTASDIASVMINDAINNGIVQTWSSDKIFKEIQSAVTQAQTGALVYKGNYNPNTNTPAITTAGLGVKTGWTYVVSVAGTFLGEAVEAGDMIIAQVDNPLTNINNWQTVNKNIPAIVEATMVVKGIIRIATQAEVNAGTVNDAAVTPATLANILNTQVKGYAANFGNGSSTTFTITHGLNTQDVLVQVQRVSDRKEVIVEWAAPTPTTVTIALNVAPSTNGYRVLITPI